MPRADAPKFGSFTPDVPQLVGNMEVFRTASIGTLNHLVDRATTQAGLDPNVSVVDYYSRVASAFPSRMPQEAFGTAVSAIAAGQQEGASDQNRREAQIGRKVLTALSLGTILSRAEKYASYDRGDKDDMVQGAVAAVYEDSVTAPGRTISPLQHAHRLTRETIESYLGEREHMPADWIKKGKVGSILQRTDREITSGRFTNPQSFINYEIDALARELEVDPEVYRDFFVSRRSLGAFGEIPFELREMDNYDRNRVIRRTEQALATGAYYDTRKGMEKALFAIARELGVNPESYRAFFAYRKIYGIHADEQGTQGAFPQDARTTDDVEQRIDVRAALNWLNRQGTAGSKEARVLLLRYGFLDGEQMTLDEIPKRVDTLQGLSRERIRQLEAKGNVRIKAEKILDVTEEVKPGGTTVQQRIETWRRVVYMRSKDMSDEKISEELGIPKSTIRMYAGIEDRFQEMRFSRIRSHSANKPSEIDARIEGAIYQLNKGSLDVGLVLGALGGDRDPERAWKVLEHFGYQASSAESPQTGNPTQQVSELRRASPHVVSADAQTDSQEFDAPEPDVQGGGAVIPPARSHRLHFRREDWDF